MKIIENHFEKNFFSNDEYNLIMKLLTLDQQQLFSDWEEPGTNDAKNREDEGAFNIRL